MPASVLVFGHSGQVATELALCLPQTSFLDRQAVDLSDAAACEKAIRKASPAIVINTAAYTAVDRAEEEPDLAHAVNGTAPGAMARTCATLGIPLVHISTDYVFDGRGTTPHLPDAPTAPLGVYGASKLAGEELIRSSGAIHVILRTSWVFSAHGANFVKTMLRLGGERDQLRIVADQIGGPTSAAAIAKAICAVSETILRDPTAGGTYHFSGAPDVSWAGFAREIFAQGGLEISIEDIPTSAFPTPAARPVNSRLDCTRTQEVFGLAQPDWRVDLAEVLSALGHKKQGI